jgi:protein SCO1/2
LKRLAFSVGAAALAVLCAAAAQRYLATGLVLKVDRPHRTMVVSCEDIPGYMDAMVMSFAVHESKELDGLEPGKRVDFTVVVDKDSAHAESVRVHDFESLEQEPQAARRLRLVENLATPDAPAKLLSVGQPVPNFTLTDQSRQQVSLSQFAGAVVAINFIYTRCPLPNYCFRLSNNFGLLQKRFRNRLGRDLLLLTITFDPQHDQPEVLANYARTWNADRRGWRFLTGTLEDIQRISGMFGVTYWPDESLLTHSLQTVIIDRQGRLAASLEGNQFSAQQLGDLVKSVMDRSK